MAQTKKSIRKAELQTQLKEVGEQLKTLRAQFLDIKKRSQASTTSARQRRDERKLNEIRKSIGLV